MRLLPGACTHGVPLAVLASQAPQPSGKGLAHPGVQPLYGPACARVLRGVRSRERRTLFSDIIELAGAIANSTGCVCDPTAVLRPAAMESLEDFDNYAG